LIPSVSFQSSSDFPGKIHEDYSSEEKKGGYLYLNAELSINN